MLQVMAEETWMTAAQAHEHGFTDDVIAPPAKKTDDDVDARAVAAKFPALAAAVSTEDRVRSVLQARRLAQLSAGSKSAAPPRSTAVTPAAPPKR
jgi:enoyl-CoA hydratase/carnithine racemase